MTESRPKDLTVNSKKLEPHNRRKRVKPNGLPIIHERAAGIDIGSRFHVVAVSPELCYEPVQTFQAFTSDLIRMAARVHVMHIPAPPGTVPVLRERHTSSKLNDL
jgi:hypothetical protein